MNKQYYNRKITIRPTPFNLINSSYLNKLQNKNLHQIITINKLYKKFLEFNYVIS